MARTYTKKYPPDAAMLERAANEGSVKISPDKEELKLYIRNRLKEGKVSTYTLAEAIGKKRGGLMSQLMPNSSISYEFIERLLWIVDGDDCPYRYNGENNVRSSMEPFDFQIKHPSAAIVDYLQDEWKILYNNEVYIYNKVDWSLKDALKDLDSKI